MSQIPIADLSEGMVFSEPVYVEGDDLLALSRIPLRQKDIDRLVRWEVDAVVTEGVVLTEEDLKRERESNFLCTQDNALEEFYSERLERISVIFRRVANGQEVEQEEVYSIGGELLQQVISDRNAAVALIFTQPNTDNDLAIRSLNSTLIALVVGLGIKLNSHRLIQLATGSLMHDVGMVQVSEDIIAKTDKLTNEELAEIRTHTLLGYQHLSKNMRYPADIALMALQHHERWDGTGYPQRLKGEEIALSARIITIADSYLAMVKDRPYRSSMIGYTAIKAVLGDNGSHFDPKMLKAFLDSIGIFPVGSIVQLNDSSIGRVVSPNVDAPLRPRLELLVDAAGTRLKIPEPLDIVERQKIFITKAVDPREYAEG